MVSGATAAEPAQLPDWVLADHLDQVQRLNRQVLTLKADRSWYDAGIVPTTFHPAANILPTDQDAAQVLWRRTRVLLDELKTLAPAVAAGFDAPLAALKSRMEAEAPVVVDAASVPRIDPRTKAQVKDRSGKVVVDRREPVLDPSHPRVRLALDILALQRRIALSNPLLGDCDLLLCLRRSEGHIASQYKQVGGDARSGLFRLSEYRTDAPVLTELLQGATVSQGRLAGHSLDGPTRIAGKLEPGAFGWPDLSYDGKQVLFAWKEAHVCDHGREDTVSYYNGTGTSQYARERCFHIFSLDLESKAPDRLRMLTDGSGNDAHPSYLPNGRVVFLSDRRGGVERCGGPPRATVLHSMNLDGSDQVSLSVHETSEFSPSVDNNGEIIYSRWDYIDRGDCIAHHIWTCYPDGRDPRAPHGNYPSGKFRPNAEVEIKAIPGDHRLIGVAASHHSQGHAGCLIVLDLSLPDDDGMSQVRRFTPDIVMPETRDKTLGNTILACPWPLSIHFTLAGSDRGPVLVDAFGNQTLLVRTDLDRKTVFPTREVIPLRPRSRPPIIPTQTATGRPLNEPAQTAEIPKTRAFTVINVYNSLKPWPKDTAITALRIVQIYPKANTTWMCKPDVGMGPESLVRGVIGTVPVESDGSVRFEIPANRLVYFQALDAKGRAVQTMRSGTYLQPGAQVTCLGCHEPKNQAPPLPTTMPLALRQPVRQPAIGPTGSNPVFFPALVQPVLDRQCVSCHQKTRQEAGAEVKGKKMPPDFSTTPIGPSVYKYNAPQISNKPVDPTVPFYVTQGANTFWTKSYLSLCAYSGVTFGNQGGGEGRTTPGTFGTFSSKLYPLLADAKHHGVKLSAEEMERLIIWMDLNSNFLGHYLFTEEQSRGILPALPPTTYFDTSDHPEARIPITAQRKAK